MTSEQSPAPKLKSLNKLIELDDKYELEAQQKKKVASVLQEQVQFLLDKKQKEKQKKRRIKMMQEQFERKRKMKIEQFQHKNIASQKTKQNVIKEKIEKNKKNLQHIEKVHKKVHQQHEQLVQKGMQKRKQFYSYEISRNPKINTKSETQQNFKKRSQQKNMNDSVLNHSQTSKQIQSPKLNVELQMKQIQQKLSKAKNNHKLYQKQLIEKLQQKDRHHSEIQQKIRSHSMMEEQKYFKQLYGKNEHIIGAGQKVKDLTEKHLNDRRKSFQDKIKKLHENIKFIESEKVEKFNELENKLSKIYETNPLNRGSSNHSKTHRDRVLLNNLRLQELKNQKAQEILKKHTEITAKNKIYKEKKDQILQVIKKTNPQKEQ